jgi:hypothetical protein
MFKAGVAEIDITPPFGTWLIGHQAASTGVRDPLMARALVLSDGDANYALIALDLCGLSREDSDAIRRRVARACHASPARVILMLSHTHSAPFSIPWSVTGWSRFCNADAGWRAGLPERIAAAAEEAACGLFEARLASGRAALNVGANRRLSAPDAPGRTEMAPNPDGPVVPWSDVLAVRDAGGAARAVLYSQAAHPVMLHWASTVISADYPGDAGRRIRERLGAQAMPLFAQSCGADNNAPWATGSDNCARIGEQLGDSVADTVNSAAALPGGELRFASATLDLPLKEFEPEEQLVSLIAAECARLSRETGDAWAREPLLEYQEKLQRVRAGRAPSTMPMDIAVLAFGGELAIVALSHEVFAGYQLEIDRLSPFPRTIVWAYCQYTENYIPTDCEHRRGGYEIIGGPAAYRHRAGPARGAEALILDRVSGLLRQARGLR